MHNIRFFNRFLISLLVTALCFSEAFFVMPEICPSSYAEDDINTVIVYKEDEPSELLYADSGYGLDTLVLPAYASGYDMTWESSDTDAATVDSRGRVHGRLTGKYEGYAEATCYVTARVSWNGRTAEDTVKVIVKNPVAISLSSEGKADLQSDHVKGQMVAVFESKTSNSDIRDIVDKCDASCEDITKADSGKIALIDAGSDEELADTMGSLEEEASVTHVQPNYTYTLDSGAYPQAGGYFHDTAGISDAWDLLYSRGFTKAATVGVVDSGVDATHPDLKQNLVLDSSGRYTSYINGGEVKRTSDSATLNGHGTHVAGIVGAVYDSGNDVAGVASGKDNDLSRVLVVGFGRDDSRYFSTYDVIGAINVAADRGAQIINMSFGGSSHDLLLGHTILDHYYNDGIVFVSSAGNADTAADASRIAAGNYDFYSFPSDLKEVISVCNVDSSGKRHRSYSGYAKDISAPGTSIKSTLPDGSFGSSSGTSMSAPVISGICALILDADPDLKPHEVRNILCATAEDNDDYIRENEMGYGTADASAAVQAAYDAKEPPSEEAPLSIEIKTSYGGEPIDTSKQNTNRYKVSTSTTVTKQLSKTKSLKASPSGKTVKLSFKRSELITKTEKVTDKEDLYTGEITTETSATVKKSQSSGIKYYITVTDLKTGSYKVYRLKSKSTSNSKYKAVLKASAMKVQLKKYGSAGFKRGHKYQIDVFAYRSVDDTMIRSKLSKRVKVRIR